MKLLLLTEVFGEEAGGGANCHNVLWCCCCCCWSRAPILVLHPVRPIPHEPPLTTCPRLALQHCSLLPPPTPLLVPPPLVCLGESLQVYLAHQGPNFPPPLLGNPPGAGTAPDATGTSSHGGRVAAVGEADS